MFTQDTELIEDVIQEVFVTVWELRAAFKCGESRPDVLVERFPKAEALQTGEREAPFPASANSYDPIMVTENHFTTGTTETIREGYIPFVYNEKNREFLAE
jgi:starch-binding outer membrane protein, SusD/RagB family